MHVPTSQIIHCHERITGLTIDQLGGLCVRRQRLPPKTTAVCCGRLDEPTAAAERDDRQRVERFRSSTRSRPSHATRM